ncbi:MAG: XTP/dITP diphosphatase [Alphaproteobacteria bacterium]|nr:XTP/dITP diphosphatase [Alphaproteobacteria bacterium]
MKELIFASHNKGKIAEIKQILSPFNIKVISSDDVDLPDVEETGTTFEENAVLKALGIAKMKNFPCLADDSGLCVNALNGRPGVYSARYAPNRDFDKAMDMLLKEIEDTKSSDRSAYFACVLVLGYPDGTYKSFEGRVDGVIIKQKQGSSGFGFDPVFAPLGYDKTFAELGAEIKNKISHRGRALEKFTEYLNTLK